MHYLHNFLIFIFLNANMVYSGNLPECGTIGSVDEERSKWPWHAILFRKYPERQRNPFDFEYACGGTLVNRNTILTSARCVTNQEDRKPFPAELTRVVLAPAGRDFLSNSEDPNSQLLKIAKIIIHPEFDYPSMTHNIAVIKLQLDATVNAYVRPICFPFNNSGDNEITNYQLQPGRNGMVAGYGMDISSRKMSKTLKEFNFFIESESDCFNDFKRKIHPSKFCAGYSGFVPLIMSNGGGLAFPVPQEKLQFYIQGIVCHDKNEEASPMKFLGTKSNIMLLRVVSYRDWLLQYLEAPVGDNQLNFQVPQDEDSTQLFTTTSTTPVSSTEALPTITTETFRTTKRFVTTTYKPKTIPTTVTMMQAMITPQTTTSITSASATTELPEKNYPQDNSNNSSNKNVASKLGFSTQPIKCPSITPPESSNIKVTCTFPSDRGTEKKNCTTETFVGVRASFECKPYYKRTVSNAFFSKTCQPNGQWSHNDKTFGCDLDCGISEKSTEKMIVHGKSSSTRKWPWHVALFRKNFGTFQYICGGALIQPNVVITASHCVTDDIGGRLEPYLFQVVLGAISSDLSENYDDKEPQVFKISEIFTHPQYNYINADADVALITLKGDAKITDRVHPVCFPYSDDDEALTDYMLSPGSNGIIAGFGFDESWKMSPLLQELQMPVVSYRDCSKVLELQYNPTSQFCAGYINGSSPCEGDSGGALVFPSDTIPVRYYIQGIVSYGAVAKNTDRCDNKKYTVFSRVASFRNWTTDKLSDIYSS